MLSLGNTDTSNCVVYLENYLDSVENLPDDLQRHLTRMRELDVSYQSKNYWKILFFHSFPHFSRITLHLAELCLIHEIPDIKQG